MKSIYAIYKIAAVIAVTLSIYTVFITGYGILVLFKVEPDSWRNRCLMLWGKSAAKSLSITVKAVGKPPEPPFFLVSNHLSYVDIIVLFSALKTTFVAKKEVSEWPVVGQIAKTIGVVFIDRKRRSDVARVNNEINRSISDNRGLTLFPEGTTSPGTGILRFRASLLEFPAQSKLGAHYCALRYSTNSDKDLAYKTVCWWGDSMLHTHLFNLAREQNIEATITFGDNVIHDNDRKILSVKLQKKVNELFQPMCDPKKIEFSPIEF